MTSDNRNLRARDEALSSSSHWPPRTIVVAVDEHASSGDLVDRATTLALLLGARLVVAHAVCARADNVPRDVSGLLEGLEGLDVMAHARVAAWAQRATKPGIAVSTYVLHGMPVRVLADVARAERADLVVLGAHRKSRATRAAAGTLAAELMGLATCAVLSLPVD